MRHDTIMEIEADSPVMITAGLRASHANRVGSKYASRNATQMWYTKSALYSAVCRAVAPVKYPA